MHDSSSQEPVAEPRPAPLQFAQAILRQDIRQYDEQASRSGLVFFERGIVDALGMLHDVGGLPPNKHVKR
jgi:predicted ATPase